MREEGAPGAPGGPASAPGREGGPADGGGPAAGSRPAPADPLDGTGWTLVRYVADGALVDLPAGVRADARFADGRVSGSAACNSYTAGCAVEPSMEGGPSSGTLRIGPCATTMMACPPPHADVERDFLAALAATAAFTVVEDRLTLLDAAGTVLAELAAVPADAYLGTWEATGVNNGRQAVVSLVADSSISLHLAPDGRVAGNATCNRYIGAFTVDGESIVFGPLASTRMACPTDDLAEQERAYLAALAAATTWSVRGDRLELRDATGALQAGYRRA